MIAYDARVFNLTSAQFLLSECCRNPTHDRINDFNKRKGQIGLVEMDGSFIIQDNHNCLKSKEAITFIYKIKNNRFHALSVRTAEDIGEILYRE